MSIRSRRSSNRQLPSELKSADWKKSEFAAASDFLTQVAKLVRGARGRARCERIFVVPGNHDVAWLGDKNSLDAFRDAIPSNRFITPFTTASRSSSGGMQLTATSERASDGTPLCVVKCSLRGVELIVALLVSHYWEGELPDSKLTIDKIAHKEIRQVRAEILKGWQRVQPAKLLHTIELVERFTIHRPLVTPEYIGKTAVLLRKVLGNATHPENQTRLCVVHSPLLQVLGATGDAVEAGESLWFGWHGLFRAEGQPAFHAVLSGHLHAMGAMYHPNIKGWSISAGSATVAIDPDAVPNQSGNNFWEFTLDFLDGKSERSCIPFEWNGNIWKPNQERRIDLRS